MEQLAVLDVVAELELVVTEQVPVRVEDPLRETRGPRRVIELRRVVGRRVHPREHRIAGGDQVVVEDEDVLDGEAEPTDAFGVLGVREQHLRLRVAHAVVDAVVAVQHRQGEQDRTRLERPQERGRRLRPGGEEHRDAVSGRHAVPSEDAREPAAPFLQLPPSDLPLVATVVLPQHRELVGRVLVADVLRDVVALWDDPLVGGDGLVVARKPAV